MPAGPTMEQLRKVTQDRPDKHDFYMWSVMRRISIYVTWLSVRTPVTPNQITLLSLLAGLAGAAFFASSDPLYWLAGWLVVNIHLILDQVDGEVARWKKMTTKFGYFFDEVTHPIVNTALFVAAAMGLYAMSGDAQMLVVGLTLVFSASVLRMAGVYSDYASKNMYKLETRKLGAPKSWVARIAGVPFGLGGYFHVLSLAALLDVLFIAPVVNVGITISSSREIFFLAMAAAVPLFCVKKIFRLRKTLKDSRL